MAGGADSSSDVAHWRQKYETSEQKLQELKQLSHKAVSDYEELQRKYDQNQKAYEELKVRLQDTEYQLQGFQRVLEPACQEFQQLQSLYTIEQGCRNEAEKYASTVNKQNKKLKRQSQMLLETIETQNIPLERLNEISLAGVAEEDETASVIDDSRVEELSAKVEQLEKHIALLQERVSEVEEDRDKATESELVLRRELEYYQGLYTEAKKALEQQEQTINHYSKVSQQACAEHEELTAKYEQERKLREEAEKYASNMSAQREAIARESSVLLASAAADMRLTEAFLQIEDLQKELDTLKDESQRKVSELEATIENDISTKRVEELESRLEVATEEISQQQKQIKELEKWKLKLEKDYKDLEQELDVTKQKIPVIPPPPPPPPASLFSVFRPTKIKKSAAKANAAADKAKEDKNPAYSKALDEMMERIRSGTTLRPRTERRDFQKQPSLPEYQTKGKSSAMEELNQLLQKTRNRSAMDDSEIGRSSTVAASLPSDSELQKTFNRVRNLQQGPSTPVSPTAPNLERISEEK